MKLDGLLISAMGIPGSGKSSVFRLLAQLLKTNAAFFEPEEDDEFTPWPKAVSARDIYGYFGSITWFRSMRVPLLFDAARASANGEIALIDSYYDKLLYNYLGQNGLDWFYPKNDKYYSILQQLAEYDYNYLPFADLIVFFSIDRPLWDKRRIRRGRNMDHERAFESQCFSLQEPMMLACEKYANDFQKQIIYFEQSDLSPDQSAQKLIQLLDTFDA